MESARQAVEADLPALERLARLAVGELSEVRGGTMWRETMARAEPIVASLEHDLDDDATLVVAGTIDDVVVGYATVRAKALESGACVASLTDIYVEPPARAVGVGEAMMSEIVEWATERRCVGVDSVALPGDRATKNFFETHGLVARAILVHRRLDD